MYKLFVLIIIAFMSISCGMTPEVSSKDVNTKAFEQEDTYILFGLRAEQLHNYAGASDIFETLYEKSEKKEYLYRSLENDLAAKENEKIITRVDAAQFEHSYDPALIRLKILALVELSRLDEARDLAIALAKKTNLSKDYILTSDIYIKRQEHDLAVRYLESAYAKENDEKILDLMAVVMYVNLGEKKEAIAHLETHIQMHGTSKLTCARLAAFYSNDNNINGLLSTYLKLYKLEKNEQVAQKIVQIYTYKRDFLPLMAFLEESKSDNKVLLQLLVSSKKYAKAHTLAYELYLESADMNYLGQSAIYEYEAAQNKNDKKMLESVITNLSTVAESDSSPMYLNYLGYILIDHNIDIQKGMNYIDEVLKEEPNSAFYLDSKAWGYYRLGECAQAKKLIQKVLTLEGGDDPEVLEHKNKINKCKRGKRNI